MSQPAADIESDLIDLAEVTLADLPSYDERTLAPAMRRMLQGIDDPDSMPTSYNPQRLD